MWTVVVPVKPLAVAKTRLRGAVPDHERLVLALAQDTVRAVRACRVVAEVLVVSDDPVAARVLRALGARVVPDAPAAGRQVPEELFDTSFHSGPPTHLPGPIQRSAPGQGGLNEALAYGAGQAATDPVAAIAADLPALRPAELAAALDAAAGIPGQSFVPDRAGTGTTLLAAPPGVVLDPRFGPGSADRHSAAGAQRLDGSWPTLRRDVDTPADLADAARLGVGPHTAAVLRGTMRPPA